jgi:hypothetical protein
MNDEERGKLNKEYLLRRDHKALAIKPNLNGSGFWASTTRRTQDEAVRLAVERCGDLLQAACLLVSVDGFLTVQIPRSRRVADVFMLTTINASDQDRQALEKIYAEDDWRAIARGRSGGWYAVANQLSESAAVQAALSACAQRDSQCVIHAISNFWVADP